MSGKELLPAPTSFEGAMQLATTLSKSQLIPKQFQGRPQDVVVAMMWSHTLGIPVVQGLQHIAVVNGRPSMYGDGMLAVVMASGQMNGIKEELKGSGDGLTAICQVTRKGIETPFIGSFSVEDAKRATLWDKQGPWKQYPKRMLKMRARAFALRDAFPDVLSGIGSGEEQEDIIIGEHAEQSNPPAADEKSTRKMPRRKKAAAADEATVVDAEVAQTEPQVPQDEPAEPAAQNAPVQDNSQEFDKVLEQLHQARTRQDLMQIWVSMPTDMQSNPAIRDAFQRRQADISLAATEGADQ